MSSSSPSPADGRLRLRGHAPGHERRVAADVVQVGEASGAHLFDGAGAAVAASAVDVVRLRAVKPGNGARKRRIAHVDEAGARLVDVGDPAFASTIAGLDRSKTYYVYCRSGNRSARAIEQMRAAGFAHLHNVGGYAALVAGGVPSEP